MFHMLTCFDLKSGHSIQEFQHSLAKYTKHMNELGLVEGNSSIGLRQSDSILDTDDERKQEYFVTMHFRERVQSDKAIEHIKSHKEPAKSLHHNAYSITENLIFISWRDIDK